MLLNFLSSVSFRQIFKLILYYLFDYIFAPYGFCLNLLVSFNIGHTHIFSLDKMTSVRKSFVHIDLHFLCKLNTSFEICQKQVAGLLEKEQRHAVKLNIG